MAVSSLIYVLFLTAAIVEGGWQATCLLYLLVFWGFFGEVQTRDSEQQISVLDVLEARCL